MEKSQPRSYNIYIILLVVISFFAGYFYFKGQPLEKKSAADKQPQKQKQSSQNLDLMPKVTDKDHIRGTKNAEILLVEYSDFECPFCKRFHPTMQQVVKEYGNKVAWAYRHFPLAFHQNAQKEAEATECANELGGNEAFWKYTDKIFEKTTSNGTGLPLDQLGVLASEIDLNPSAFQQCLDSGKYAKHVQEDMAGGTKAGIRGTPGTIIVLKNGKKDLINGALAFEQVKQQIDIVLK